MKIFAEKHEPLELKPSDSPKSVVQPPQSDDAWWICPDDLDCPAAPGGASDPPRVSPAPCPKCGCPFWWESIVGRQLHCCQCVRVPSRHMLVELWRVTTPAGDSAGPYGWEAWDPGEHWNPFEHLDAELEAFEAAEAAKETF